MISAIVDQLPRTPMLHPQQLHILEQTRILDPQLLEPRRILIHKHHNPCILPDVLNKNLPRRLLRVHQTRLNHLRANAIQDRRLLLHTKQVHHLLASHELSHIRQELLMFRMHLLLRQAQHHLLALDTRLVQRLHKPVPQLLENHLAATVHKLRGLETNQAELHERGHQLQHERRHAARSHNTAVASHRLHGVAEAADELQRGLVERKRDPLLLLVVLVEGDLDELADLLEVIGGRVAVGGVSGSGLGGGVGMAGDNYAGLGLLEVGEVGVSTEGVQLVGVVEVHLGHCLVGELVALDVDGVDETGGVQPVALVVPLEEDVVAGGVGRERDAHVAEEGGDYAEGEGVVEALVLLEVDGAHLVVEVDGGLDDVLEDVLEVLQARQYGGVLLLVLRRK
jgi:hypothetical protein